MSRRIPFLGLLVLTGFFFVPVRAMADPLVPQDQLNLSVPYNTTLDITLAATGGENPLTFFIPQQTSIGVLQMDGNNPTLAHYTPPTGFWGDETLRFGVTDSNGETREGLLKITTIHPDVQTSLYIEYPAGSGNLIFIVSAPNYGSLMLNFNPQAFCEANNIPSGTYVFHFVAENEGGGTAQGEQSHQVDVDPPVLTWLSYPGFPGENQCVSGTIEMSLSAIDNFRDCPTDDHMQLPQLIDPDDGQYLEFKRIDGECSNFIFPEYNTDQITDGEQEFVALGSDVPGNESDLISFHVTVDNTAPANLDIDFSPELPVSHVIRGSYDVVFTAVDATCGMGSLKLTAHSGNDVVIGNNNNQSSLTAQWNTQNFADGTYTIIAEAIDKVANQDSLETAAITIDNTAPSLTITNPANNSEVSASITISATASDSHGVDRVEFYIGGQLLGTDTVEPYSQAWDTTQHSNGAVAVSAKAYDTVGNIKEIIHNVTINNSDNTPPTVALLSPTEGSQLHGLVNVSGTASDNVTVTLVELLVDGVVKGALSNPPSPFVISWDTTGSNNGSRSIQLKAYDGTNSTIIDPVGVIVDNEVPSTVLISPINDAHIRGLFTFVGSALDNIGISQVEFFRDNDVSLGLGTGDGNNYSVSDFNTITLSNGSHTFWTVAKDGANNTAQSEIITAVVDNSAPTTFITNPTDGSEVVGTIIIEADAQDNIGVTQVDFYRDENIFIGQGTFGNGHYSAPPLDTTGLSNGSHSFYSIAGDQAGNTTTSPLVNVTVNNAVSDQTPPTISITKPDNDATLEGDVEIEGTAADDVAVTQIDIYAGAVRIHQIVFNPPLQNADYAWTWPAPANGDYVLTARAFDAEENEGVSDSRLIHVSGNGDPSDMTPPTVSITRPENNDEVEGDVTIEGNFSDDVGVKQLNIYADGNLIKQIFIDPPSTNDNFSWTWPAPAEGDYTLQVKVYDATPNEGVSESPLVHVLGNDPPDTTSPTVQIASPAHLALVRGTLSVTGTASDNIAVTRVELYRDGSYQATQQGPLSSFAFDLNTIGFSNSNHTLEARAFDAAENMGTHQIQITVDNEAPQASIVDPVEGNEVHGLTTISAVASDNQGLNRMEFLVDGVVKQNLNGAGPSYTFEWNAGSEPEGAHALQVKIYDNAGNVGSSSVVNVTVENDDTIPPTVSITAPQNGNFIRGLISIAATASDNFGVNHVDFYDGSQLLGTDSASPYVMGWDTTDITLKNVSLTAQAFDGSTNNTASNPVTITVDNGAPTISNFSPADGSQWSDIQIIQFAGQDNAALLRLEIWVNNTLIHSRDYAPGTTSDVLSYSYDTTVLPDGNYPVEARAYDQAGGMASIVHNVQTVNGPAGSAPVVTILNPENNEAISDYVYVLARITNSPTSTSMRIDGGTPVSGTWVQADEYQFGWNTENVIDGVHTIEVSASNDSGSHAASIQVTVDNTAPVITWLTPDPVAPPNPDQLFWVVNLLANVTDNNPTVDYVRFYLNTNLPENTLASFIDDPAIGNFNYLFDTLQEKEGARVYPDGSYTLGVTARDQAGNITNAELAVFIENDDIPTSDGSLELHPALGAFVALEPESLIWVRPINATIDPQYLNEQTFSVTYIKDGREQHLNGNAQLVDGDVYFTAIVPSNSKVTNVSAQFLDTTGLLLAANWWFTRAMDAETGGEVKSADDRIRVQLPANSLIEDAFVDIDIVDPNEMPPAMQEANEASGSNPDSLVWQQPYYMTATNSSEEQVLGLTPGVAGTFTFEEENSQIPDLYQNYIFQPQSLILGDNPHWKPLTGFDLLGASAEPGVKTISAPIEQMGYFRISYFPAPAPGITDFFNFPNPFSPHEGGTDLTYLLGEDSDVTIIIYDLLGNLVRKVDVPMGAPGGQAGQNIVHWSGHNGKGDEVANGGYIIQLIAKSASGQTYKERHKAAVAK